MGDETGTHDEGGVPAHMPMPVTRDGSGPETGRPHHYVCWCHDDQCMWNKAFREDRWLTLGRSRRLLGAAVDEIYLLRAILADEAMIIKAHLEYKTFPKTRRRIADEQVVRMALFAEGRLRPNLRRTFDAVRAFKLVNVSPALTVGRWLAERNLEDDHPLLHDGKSNPEAH